MKYAAFSDFVASVLPSEYANVGIHPGPDMPPTPERFVVLTPFPGAGFSVEGVMDARAWQIRVAGAQHSYEDAEALAWAIDKALTGTFSQNIGGIWVASINRIGGGPSVLFRDNADRTHFVASYQIDVESG